MTGVNDWQTKARERLRAAGYRLGAASSSIVDSLAAQDCCRSAQEIHAELGARVGLASVYRVLDALVEQGVVQRVEIGDGVARFEPHRSGEGHHHHLVCNGCGKVEAFEDATLEHAIEAVERESGYAVAAHDVVLRGACTDCR
jgi:Fur family transcriptional regulator, ferric uptake regulator